MPHVLTVEHQDFSFDDSWLVVKYDECADCLRLQQGTAGANAVDIVGAESGCTLSKPRTIGFGDSGCPTRNSRNGSRPRFVMRSPGSLAFSEPARGPAQWRRFMRSLRNHKGNVLVVLFVEDLERTERSGNRWKPKATVIRGLLRTKLKWLGPEVQVVTPQAHGIPGLTVTSRPGAGQQGGA